MSTILFVDLDRQWAIPLLENELRDYGWRLDLRRESLDEALMTLAGEDIQSIEVLSTFIGSRVGKAELEKLPHLKLICTRSTGFDHIDLGEAYRRGVTVCNVPLYGENTVAEHTFALILSLSRKLRETYERVRRDEFHLAKLEGFDLRGKTLGVVGTGHIGLRVIQIARGFSMQVIAHDPREQHLLSDVLGFRYVSLEELLSHSDIVSLHAPLLQKTHHLINADSLTLMKKGALLINTSRGALVDTDALLGALTAGHLGGAGLDVLEHEAMLLDEDQARAGLHNLDGMRATLLNNLLVRRDDVIFTPHLGFNSREANERIFLTTVQNIVAYYDGQPKNIVQPTEV